MRCRPTEKVVDWNSVAAHEQRALHLERRGSASRAASTAPWGRAKARELLLTMLSILAQ